MQLRIFNEQGVVKVCNQAGKTLSECWQGYQCLNCGKDLATGNKERTFCPDCLPVVGNKCHVEHCHSRATVRVIRPEKHRDARLCGKHADLLEIEESEQIDGAWL